jgi:hypothetical protein
MPDYDFTRIINAFGNAIPIDQSILLMIKTYATLKPKPVLADFHETHHGKLHQIMGLREQGFIDRCDREIGDIESLWTN